MRKKNNLDQFGHTTKSRDQKIAYAEMVEGKQMRGSTVDEEYRADFADTSAVEGRLEGDEPITKSGQKPYRSWKTTFDESKGAVFTILITILLSLGGWLLLNVNSNDKDIDKHDFRIDSLENSVQDNSLKVEKINEDVIRNDVRIEQLEKTNSE